MDEAMSAENKTFLREFIFGEEEVDKSRRGCFLKAFVLPLVCLLAGIGIGVLLPIHFQHHLKFRDSLQDFLDEHCVPGTIDNLTDSTKWPAIVQDTCTADYAICCNATDSFNHDRAACYCQHGTYDLEFDSWNQSYFSQH